MKITEWVFLFLSLFPFVGHAKDLSSLGLVDVTAAPFYADPNGEKDCTETLQRAIDYAQKQHRVAYFPEGIYKISNTLECRHDPPPREERGKFESGRYWGITLLGSTSGKNRPRIVLAPHSSGYDNVGQPRLVLYFHQGKPRPRPPIYPRMAPSFMNSRLIGIDVEIGEGNPGAVAVRMRGAQGMAIEDVTLDVTHGLIGLEGGNGSGGGNTNVTIIGGKIGFDGSATQPTPSITGFTFVDQTEHAILYRGRHTLNATGIEITSKHPITAVKAVDLWTQDETSTDGLNGSKDQGLFCWNGPVNFVDCEVNFTGRAGTAFASNCGVYLNNCYVRNAKVLVDHTDGGKLAGKTGKWVQIKEYAQGYNMRQFQSLKYTSPIYINGKKQHQGISEIAAGIGPPDDLVSRHVWSDDFPSWQSPGAVNVKNPPYHAKGDGVTDDTRAIQKAIDENEIVFVPAGLYRITKTIDLKSNTKLIGLMPNITGLVVVKAEGDFAAPHHPQPILRTPNNADATTVIAFIGTWTHGGNACYNLLWRVGRRSIIRDWMVMHTRMELTEERTHKSVVVTGNGGGRWYNYYDETWSREYRPSYRHLYVEGTTEPFRIYQCNPEHARSEANMEIRNAQNVTLYGVKGEGNYPIVLIRHCDNIRIFGYGGNAPPWPHTSVYLVENSTNLLLANMFNQVRTHEGKGLDGFGGPNVDPSLWHMFIERFPDGSELRTPPLERPVLYKQGTTKDVWEQFVQ
jgi:hypothetical protein